MASAPIANIQLGKRERDDEHNVSKRARVQARQMSLCDILNPVFTVFLPLLGEKPLLAMRACNHQWLDEIKRRVAPHVAVLLYLDHILRSEAVPMFDVDWEEFDNLCQALSLETRMAVPRIKCLRTGMPWKCLDKPQKAIPVSGMKMLNHPIMALAICVLSSAGWVKEEVLRAFSRLWTKANYDGLLIWHTKIRQNKNSHRLLFKSYHPFSFYGESYPFIDAVYRFLTDHVKSHFSLYDMARLEWYAEATKCLADVSLARSDKRLWPPL